MITVLSGFKHTLLLNSFNVFTFYESSNQHLHVITKMKYTQIQVSIFERIKALPSPILS